MIFQKEYEDFHCALVEAFRKKQITYDEFHLIELDLIRINRKISKLKINKGVNA